jgi:hypothetical protein
MCPQGDDFITIVVVWYMSALAGTKKGWGKCKIQTEIRYKLLRLNASVKWDYGNWFAEL